MSTQIADWMKGQVVGMSEVMNNPLSDPIGMMMNVVSAVGTENPFRDDVLNDTIGDTIIDTCVAFDTHLWETGINRDGSWVIVEQYADRNAAVEGHAKWKALMETAPDAELTDVFWANI